MSHAQSTQLRWRLDENALGLMIRNKPYETDLQSALALFSTLNWALTVHCAWGIWPPIRPTEFGLRLTCSSISLSERTDSNVEQCRYKWIANLDNSSAVCSCLSLCFWELVTTSSVRNRISNNPHVTAPLVSRNPTSQRILNFGKAIRLILCTALPIMVSSWLSSPRFVVRHSKEHWGNTWQPPAPKNETFYPRITTSSIIRELPEVTRWLEG